ncbi:uncharacterized protein LOC131061498 isoform X2 [Cryptomeria japonica]|uniref:uncharacterized protein LOC131061498 isoform X2 n=1 Tax=Cryptomeria japonica TaxID=3369 RepID=UPI0027DA9172|nr:uncharacterized protein LOC131061498 isoform X2 [Cryptomeria japonica]
MDYHSLPRKQLQAMCKKHDIPANQTNVQMADALTTLLKAEGKPKSDANAGRMQSVSLESGKEKSVSTMKSNVPKASTRPSKEAVKSAEEEGCEEHVASVEDVESNEGAKAGKTRGRGLPKLVPESKEHKDEIDGTTRKHCRGTQRERTCKISVSDFSTVGVSSKKKKTSASEDEPVDEKARENIEGQQSLKVEETLQDQDNNGKHLRHLRKKTMPEEQTKLKVLDVGTKRTRAGKATHHLAVATEFSVKDVDGEEENVTNKLPVVIDIVDSDDDEVVYGVKDKADIVDVSVKPTADPSESLKPVVTVNSSESPKRVVTRRAHKGGDKKEEVLKTSSEDVKVSAVCSSVEPTSNSSECLKKAATLRGKREEKEVTASFEEGKVDTVNVSDESAVKQRGQKGGKKEELIVTNSIEEAKNIVTDVPVEATVNASESPKRVITRKGRKAEHKKEVLQTNSEEDKVNSVCVSAEPTSSSLKCLKQIVTRRGQKFSHKEEKLMNASSEEDKIDVVDISDEPAVNQRGRKGGKKEELIVTNSVEEAKNIVTDVPDEATVNASESPKGVVTRKGRKGEHKKVLKTVGEEDKFNAVCVSDEPTSSSLECLKQVVTRRGQKCSHREEKLMNASSEGDKIDVVDVTDEPAVDQRGRKGGKKEELTVTNSIEEAKNIVTDVPVEAPVNASESPKGVVTRKGRKGEHKKEVLKTGSEEDKFNAVCVSVEPTSSSLECLKQVVTRRGQKCSHKEEVVNASSEEDKVDVFDGRAVNRRGRKGGQKESVVITSAEEAKNIGSDVPAEVTANVSKSPKRVVTRKGCKGEHKIEEVSKANSEENKVNAVCVSVEPTLNSSESLKQVVTQRGVKCSQELLVTDSIEEAKNDTTDISVEDNVSSSVSPKRLVTRQGCKVVHEKVLDASAEESKVNPVSIPVKPIVNCSETPKHVVTRRGRINKQEGRKVVTAISSDCLKQVVTRRGGKCRQKKLLVTDSIEEAKNNATDISVEDNMNASESPKRVVTHQECKVGHEKTVNASAKESKVDPVKFTENCSKTPKRVVTRRGRINRQEEVLETNIVEEAKNMTDIPVEASLSFEDDGSVEVTGNPSLKHVTYEGQNSWFKEDLVNASPEENKVDASGMPDESIQGQGESSSEVDESDGKEKKADFRNLNDKNYGFKMKTRRTQPRQKPGKDLQQNKGNIIEDNNSDEKQKQTSSDTDGVMQKTIIRRGLRRKATYGKHNIRKSSQQEDFVQTEGHIDGGLHSSTLGDSASDQEGQFDVDNLNESLESIEEKTNRPLGDSANDQEDGDFEKKPDKVDTSADLAAKADEGLEEQTMAGSTVFIDNILDQSLESVEEDSNLTCEAGLESAVNEDDAHKLRDSSSCEEDNFNDVKEKEIDLIQDLEISQQKAACGDSFNDQEDADFEKKTEKVYTSLNLAAKDDNALEDQTMAGNGMIAGSIVFANNILDKSVESLEKDSNLPCQVDIDSAVNEEDAHELRDSSSCEEEDLNDVKEKELCLIQDVEISQKKASYGDSASDQEHDGDFEKKPEKIYTASDLAAKADEALEEQTMAGSTVFIDTILDQSLESLQKDSNLLCEAGLDSAVNDLRDSSCCEEDNFNDAKEKEIYLIQDPEISQQKAAYGDSFNDQENGDCEKKSEKGYTSLDLAAKDDDALEEQTMAGDGMIDGSTVFVDYILEKSVESLGKDSNLPCEVDIDSAVNEEDAPELRDSSSCEEDDLNDVKEKELCLIQDVEISQQKASHDDSASDHEDGDFEKKSEKVHNSSNLASKDDDTTEEQTMVGDGTIAGSTVFVDNILDKSVKSFEKDSNLPCEVGIVSAINEDDADELRESSSCEEDNFNYVNEKEVYLIQNIEISQQKVSYGDSASVQENGDFENKLEKVYTSPDLAAKDDEALEEKIMAGIGMIAGSTVFIDNILDKSVESLDKISNLQREVGIDVAVDEEDVHESRDSSSSEEGNFNDVKEKLNLIQDLDISLDEDEDSGGCPLDKISNLQREVGIDVAVDEEDVHESRDSSSSEEVNFNDVKEKLNLIQDLDISLDEDEDSGECHSGEILVVNVVEEASLSGIPLKKLEHASSSNISSCSGINDSAVEERQETLLTDCCKENLYQSDASMKISELIKGHKELCTPLKKTEFTSSTNVSSWLGMDDFVTEESVELPELDTLQEMPKLTKGHLSPHLNSLFEEDTSLKKSGLTGSTNVTPCSGMDDSASEWSQEDCMIEDCNLGVPEIDSPSSTLVLEKGHNEYLFLDTLFGEGTPLKKCELINTNAVPYLGMDDSATKRSEVSPSTEACNIEISEFDAPPKIFDCAEDNDFSFSPCLNIFDTPLKNPVLQSISGMPICSEQNQEVRSTEGCKLVHSEMFTPSKIPELTKDNERSCLNTLSVADVGMFSKKPELASSTNMSQFSGAGDSDVEQSSKIVKKEAPKLNNHDLKASSEMPEHINDQDNSPCLNTLSVKDTGTSLKNCEVTRSSDISTCSGVVDSVIHKVQEVLLTEASKNEVSSQIDDSSVEKSGDMFSTETCKLEMEPSELKSPSKTTELTKNHDRSPFLNTLFVDKTVSTLKYFEHTTSTGISACGIDDSDAEQSRDVLLAEACKLEISELNAPSEIPELSIDDDTSPCLKNLSVVITDTSLKTPIFRRGIYDSATEQGGDVLSTEICKPDLSKLSIASKMAENTEDRDRSPCLKNLFIDEMPFLSEMNDSIVDQNMDVRPTEACKQELSELDTSSKMPKVTKDQDQSPCLDTSFLEDIGNLLSKTELTSSTLVQSCSVVNDSVLEQSQVVLPLEVCKQECYEFDNALKVSELTKDNILSPCLNMLAGDFGDNSPCSGIKDFAAEQSGNVLPTETCKLSLSKLSTPQKMAELTEDHDRSPCLETLFVDDKSLLSGMDDSTADQTVDVLPTEACKQELSELDALSKTSEVTKDEDRSPCSNTVFLEGIGNLSKNIELTSSTRVQCSSVMNDSVLEQNQAVLPLEVCKQECYKYDNPLNVSELTMDHSLSPCLSMLAGDSGTALEMSQATNGTDTSVCSGGTDSGLHKMVELHRTEDSKLQMALVRQSSSTPSERPRLADIDDNAPEQDSEILPMEALKLQCCQLESQIKMEEPTEGHDNPGCQSRLAVESDLTKLSLGQLRRLYKEKQRKQKKSGKVIRKQPALQDLSSNVFGEESSSFRKSEESQQDCKTDNNVSQVNTTLNEPELVDASEKLDKSEEFYQKSTAETRLPEMTSSDRASPGDHDFLWVSPATGITTSETVFGESQQDCKTDSHCNNDVSQVNTTSEEPELAEGSEKLDTPDEFNTGSSYVLHQTSPAEIRLPEMTSNYSHRVSPGSCIDDSILEKNRKAACQIDLCFNKQPSEVYSPLNKLELAEACNRPAKLDEYSTSLKKSEDTGDHDFLSDLPASRIITSETVLVDERNGLALEEEHKPFLPNNSVESGLFVEEHKPSLPNHSVESGMFVEEHKPFLPVEEHKPFLPNNSVESGLFVEEHTGCKKTATSSKVESRIPSLADRLQILRDRLQTIQSNLQGQAPELSYATPLRKGINRRSIGSGKKSRVPMSVGRSNLAFEGAKLASTKENSTEKTPLSLKRDQRLYKENQIISKDSEKVVGKRPALRNLSANVLEQRVDFVGQTLPLDKTALHIHEEDCS